MSEERRKLLTLGQMGATNLDKWWRKMGMNLEARERKERGKMECARAAGNGAGSGGRNDIGKPLVPVRITNRY